MFLYFAFLFKIRNLAAPELCVDSKHRQRDEIVTLDECMKNKKSIHGEQNFTLTWHKDIRPNGRTMCWDVSDSSKKASISLYPCHGSKGNQYWKYDLVCTYFYISINLLLYE